MADKPVQIHFLATRGLTPLEEDTHVYGSNAIIIQEYSAKKKKYVYGMIDCGYSKDYDPSFIKKYLKVHKIKELDWVLITHYHGDHIGGLKTMLKNNVVKINKIIIPMRESMIKTVKPTLDPEDYDTTAAHLKSILGCYNTYKKKYNSNCELIYFTWSKPQDVAAKMKVNKGTYKFYNTNPKAYLKVDNNFDPPNGSIDKFSIVTGYTIYGRKILFAADIYQLTEKLLLTTFPKSDVLQMPHHASVNANSEEFIKRVNPECAISLRSGYTEGVERYKKFNPKMRVYGVWQNFNQRWGQKGTNAAIIVRVDPDGTIKYYTKRFSSTVEKGYEVRRIPAEPEYNVKKD